MTSKEKINSIKSVINEFYHDMKCKGKLTECANECWKEYQQFCEDIKQDLERLDYIYNLLKRFIDKIELKSNIFPTNFYQLVINLTEQEYNLLKEYLDDK